MPKSNVEYWTAKIDRNVERDERTRFELGRLGWKWRVIWECETSSGVERISKELQEGRKGVSRSTVAQEEDKWTSTPRR